MENTKIIQVQLASLSFVKTKISFYPDPLSQTNKKREHKKVELFVPSAGQKVSLIFFFKETVDLTKSNVEQIFLLLKDKEIPQRILSDISNDKTYYHEFDSEKLYSMLYNAIRKNNPRGWAVVDVVTLEFV